MLMKAAPYLLSLLLSDWRRNRVDGLNVMKVLLPTEAEDDLEKGDYIALDNLHRALTLVLELRDACMSLANLHLAYLLVLRYALSGSRHRVHENYLIFIE